ncbi:MAG: F390 synthetase-related protein [Trinickia sp.]|uniref:F390 synthetase-related protein n=1 Tax=Trinickia sp. TaxID=2571163 RepID=UPI003F7FE72F
MRPRELAGMASAFFRTRYGLRFDDRDALEHWQRGRLDRFLSHTVKQAAFYRDCAASDLASLPVVDKATTLADFAAFNARGITLDEAYAAARAAEAGRVPPHGFDPRLTAGLSSGTSGRPGVFLATPAERATWAGILLARVLDRPLSMRLAIGAAPIRVAFFLRANSSLYTTIASRRIDFRFFDLQTGADAHVAALVDFRPDVLVAPASVLAWLARESLAGRLPIVPHKTISVAEVLEPDDAQSIRAAYGRAVDQLYQCTEGFLGYTCAHGSLHLNEEFVHIEPEWLDDAQTRFVPIVTDFTRRTQMIVRYRLDDVLRIRAAPCGCGRVTRTLSAVEGRLDDVLWCRARRDGAPMPLFPDALRHAIARHATGVDDYSIAQHGALFHLAVHGDDRAFDSICHAVERVVDAQGMRRPAWKQTRFQAPAHTVKRRRIVCVSKLSPDARADAGDATWMPHDA